MHHARALSPPGLTSPPLLAATSPPHAPTHARSPHLTIPPPFQRQGASEQLSPLQIAGSYVGAAGTGFLFFRERGRRTAQLTRLERENGAGDLAVFQTDPLTGTRSRNTLRDLRGSRRVLALYGSKTSLSAALRQAAIYRRRLLTSGMVVVAVPSDGSAPTEWLPNSGGRPVVAPIASATTGDTDGEGWPEYFELLLSPNGGDASASAGASGVPKEVRMPTFPSRVPAHHAPTRNVASTR